MCPWLEQRKNKIYRDPAAILDYVDALITDKVKHDENGITTMSIYDFLLKENSLEL